MRHESSCLAQGEQPSSPSLLPLSPRRSFGLVDGPATGQAGLVPQQLRDEDLSCAETLARGVKELQAQTGAGTLGALLICSEQLLLQGLDLFWHLPQDIEKLGWGKGASLHK